MDGIGPMGIFFALLVAGLFGGLYWQYNTPDYLTVLSVDPATRTMLVSDNKVIVSIEYCDDPPPIGLRSFCFDKARACAVQQTTYCDDNMVGAITLFEG